MYKSVTSWQGEFNWQIDVIVDDFESISTAVNFGSSVAERLIKYPGTDYLILLDRDGKEEKIFDDRVVVRQLKPESLDKKIWNYSDFEQVHIPIIDFDRTDGLNCGFESSAFGVLDENNNSIDIKAWYERATTQRIASFIHPKLPQILFDLDGDENRQLARYTFGLICFSLLLLFLRLGLSWYFSLEPDWPATLVYLRQESPLLTSLLNFCLASLNLCVLLSLLTSVISAVLTKKFVKYSLRGFFALALVASSIRLINIFSIFVLLTIG